MAGAPATCRNVTVDCRKTQGASASPAESTDVPSARRRGWMVSGRGGPEGGTPSFALAAAAAADAPSTARAWLAPFWGGLDGAGPQDARGPRSWGRAPEGEGPPQARGFKRA